MRGLDAYIEGRNDDFFDADWEEQFEPILEQCEWITDEMLNDEKSNGILYRLISEAVDKRFQNQYISSSSRYSMMRDLAKEISTEVQQQFNQLISPQS